MVGPTCNSFLVELVHLNTGGEYLDAEPVHHQHPPVHLVRLLVVSQHITQQPWMRGIMRNNERDENSLLATIVLMTMVR